MKPMFLTLTATFLPALILIVSQPAFAKLEVHEWGTFTSLVGSNGVTQNGMYHEDEALPDFVHGLGELASDPTTPFPPVGNPSRPCRSKMCLSDQFLDHHEITQKMETPVMYFYADQTTRAQVNVKFPKGLIAETFPAPISSYPKKETLADLQNGEATFDINILSAVDSFGLSGPYVQLGNIYSHARNVASNMIQNVIGSETEKFIFYRGLGTYQPKFDISSRQGRMRISVPLSVNLPQASFLIDVDLVGDLKLMSVNFKTVFGESIAEFSAQKLAEFRDHTISSSNSVADQRASGLIVNALIKAGLNLDEAVAMIETWKHGYLKVPGLRLLSILDRAEVDELLPLTMSPPPEKIERAFISRIEVMLDTDEQKIVNDISSQLEQYKFESLGRFAESKLRSSYAACLRNGECNVVNKGQGGRLRKAFEYLIGKAAHAETATVAVQ